MVRTTTVRRCRKGLILGDDNLCYRKGDLRKRERKWNPGMKPLVTGGQRRAVTIAAKAAKDLEAHTKKLQALGLMKKPAPRRKAPAKEIHVVETGSGSVKVG